MQADKVLLSESHNSIVYDMSHNSIVYDIVFVKIRWCSMRRKTQFYSSFNIQDVVFAYKMSIWQEPGSF